MKTNFLKIVLPAFALMLAITASLAFTSDNNNSEDALEITEAKYLDDTVTPNDCTPIVEVSCQANRINGLHPVCTVTLGNGTFDLYEKTSSCDAPNILYKYIP